MVITMTVLTTRTILKTKSLTITSEDYKKDKTAVKDRVDTYGNFIWALARKFTASTDEAEAAVQEIFTDIWRYTKCGEIQSVEKLLIAQPTTS